MATRSFIRTGNLKAKNTAEEVMQWYADLQSDYRSFLNLFFGWMAIGYGTNAEDEVFYTSKEESERLRSLTIGDAKKEQLAVSFIELLLKGGENASSCYNVFYRNYKSLGKAKLTQKKNDFLSALPLLDENKIKEYFKTDEQLSQICIEEWLEYGVKNLPLPEIWAEVSPRLASIERSLGVDLRLAFGLSCIRSRDCNYCRILIEMVGRDLRSIFEKYNNHLLETEKIKLSMNDKQGPVYDSICCFAAELESKNSGLTKYVLTKGIDHVKKGTGEKTDIRLAVKELKKNKYRILIESSYSEIMSAYSCWRTKKQLEKRKLYPCFDPNRNDYKVPVGQGSLGNFTVSVEDSGDVLIEIVGVGVIRCAASCYFSGIVFDEIRNKNGRTGYSLNFCHKSISKGKKAVKAASHTGDKISGVLKEIGLRNTDSGFFVSLPYSIHHDEKNFKIAEFFMSACPKKENVENLPDKIVVGAIDLNVSNPVAAVKAVVYRDDKSGQLNALDYGSGNLIKKPFMLVANGPRIKNLIEIRDDARRVIGAIREFKVSNAVKEHVGEDTRDFLILCGDTKSSSTRYLIQSWVKKINSRLRKIKFEMRSGGYRDCADNIRLIEAMDQCASMAESYNRIHLKSGEKLVKVAKFDKSRANFRNFVLRQLASKIANEMKDCNVVFGEDLDFIFDSDKNNNALLRLFSAATLLKYIIEALEKIGVGFVKVAKNGTSQSDPVTSNPGWRDDKNKSRLYVVRDKQLGWIDSDLAATMNILIQGLNHSVCPYKFYVKEYENKPNSTQDSINAIKKPEEAIGKRIKRFFNLKYGSSVPKFVSDDRGRVTFAKKIDSTQTRLINQFVYAHSSCIVTCELHNEMVNKIKQLAVEKPNCQEFDVTCDPDGRYNNFALPEVHDSSKDVGAKALTTKDVDFKTILKDHTA